MVSSSYSFQAHLRERILPTLVRLDGLELGQRDILGTFDALVGQDLDFDLREGPRFSSNLCEEDCAIELAYTFGSEEDCGVRYSYEPTCRRSTLRNRYTLCRDRFKSTLRRCGPGYDVDRFLELFRRALPNDVLLSTRQDATATICAVHHYRDRPPRLKMYFSVDYGSDEQRALERTRALVGGLEDAALSEQLEAFLGVFEPLGCGRMVGFDFAANGGVTTKVYKRGTGLSISGLEQLVRMTEGGGTALAGLAAFQDIFLDGRRDPALFDLVTLSPSSTGRPRLKLYVRPVALYGDDEALARLRRWYAHLAKVDELALVEQGLAAVAPLDVLAETRGFFNYFSVDVSREGLSKTSVYYAPLVPLRHMARTQPERLTQLR
ncbi:MAG: tryptophan dimethylallyltransferase family protein [Myxococcota bacterium]